MAFPEIENLTNHDMSQECSTVLHVYNTPRIVNTCTLLSLCRVSDERGDSASGDQITVSGREE